MKAHDTQRNEEPCLVVTERKIRLLPRLSSHLQSICGLPWLDFYFSELYRTIDRAAASHCLPRYVYSQSSIEPKLLSLALGSNSISTSCTQIACGERGRVFYSSAANFWNHRSLHGQDIYSSHTNYWYTSANK
jgi:hypothetical protein